MTIAIDLDRMHAASTYSHPGVRSKARPRSVLDLYGRWSVLRGAIADMETDTSDDELRSLLAAESQAMRDMVAIQPRTVDELLAKLDVFLSALGETDTSRDIRLLGHAIAVDIQAWVATT
jgi:hypothetical protein